MGVIIFNFLFLNFKQIFRENILESISTGIIFWFDIKRIHKDFFFFLKFTLMYYGHKAYLKVSNSRVLVEIKKLNLNWL